MPREVIFAAGLEGGLPLIFLSDLWRLRGHVGAR